MNSITALLIEIERNPLVGWHTKMRASLLLRGILWPRGRYIGLDRR